jgi:hypothetical protein
MSSARDIIGNEKDIGGPSSFRSGLGMIRRRLYMYFRQGVNWAAIGRRISTGIGWWLVTTAIITALPLTIEYNREYTYEEIERLQVTDAIENQGASPLMLKNQGVSSAVNPSVLGGK